MVSPSKFPRTRIASGTSSFEWDVSSVYSTECTDANDVPPRLFTPKALPRRVGESLEGPRPAQTSG
jgi:hypothetical protein